MPIVQELKRRNVIKVAIAYAIVAWLLIEVTATTFPMLRLPDWTATFVTVLLMIGFPVALIFAWAFEITPEGIKLEKDVDRSQSIT
ncbi:MAG: adenylyl cyclase, partial [Gammaproteobacteria bacterium]